MKVTKKETQDFQFKQFSIQQDQCTMKVGTDGVLLGAWANTAQASNILDIGTGTGLISLMLAQRTQNAQIHAVEIDEKAALQAKSNMEASIWKERLHIHHAAIQDFARSSEQKFDLIVSNPPFFTGGTFSAKEQRNDVRHTVKLPHGDLLSTVRSLLAPEGLFCVILPFLEGLRFQELARTYNLYCNQMMEVYPKAGKDVERLLLGFERVEKEVQQSNLIIQKEKRNDWTPEYKALTEAFYLNM